MGKTGINVKIPNREYASRIVDGFSKDETYLRDIISGCVPDISGAQVDSMDYSRLLRYGNVIRGVADRIVRSPLEVHERYGEERPDQLSLFEEDSSR